MKLQDAFGIVRGDTVAFIGAGGKTSLLVGLGYELLDAGWRVLATTTKDFAEEQLQFMKQAMPYTAGAGRISDALSEHGFVFVYATIQDGRVYGPPQDWLTSVLDHIDSDVLLVEADTAHGLPLKAPYEDEPKIPAETSLVIPLVSLAALDQPLDAENVYNPKPIIAKYGFQPGSLIRSPWVAQVLRDETMGLRGIPATARVVPYVNQTPEEGYWRSRGRLIARLALREPRIEAVVLGTVRGAQPALEVQRTVGAVVLAAGKSSRMGEPKVLLPWENGKTIIEHIIEQLIRARIPQVNVVTGHYANEVKALVKPLGVRLVQNRSYRTGEMISSLKAGLRAMPDHVSAALVVLGDQPRIQPKVIYDLLKAYSEGKGEIIAPRYQGQRGHPILISRRYWPELLALRNTEAPRQVLATHEDEIGYVEVDTDSVLRDVDTPGEYAQERHRAGLPPLLSYQEPDAS
jgi:molybdenum cofactor cytidylyltransferase